MLRLRSNQLLPFSRRWLAGNDYQQAGLNFASGQPHVLSRHRHVQHTPTYKHGGMAVTLFLSLPLLQILVEASWGIHVRLPLGQWHASRLCWPGLLGFSSIATS